MTQNSNKRTLDEDSGNESSRSEKMAKPTARKLEFEKTEDDDDALPLACSICREPFLDPIVTNCNHYFCKHCALKHHEKNLNCFVCDKPTLGVFNTAVEIKKNIAKVQEKARGLLTKTQCLLKDITGPVQHDKGRLWVSVAMVKEVSTMVEKAAVLVKNAEAMGAESSEIVEEVETMVAIVEANGADLVADASWDSVIRMVENVEVVAASARDMAEMVQEANAITEKARADMAKALVVIRNVKWDV